MTQVEWEAEILRIMKTISEQLDDVIEQIKTLKTK